ncbi:MAG: hypothetical protein NT164_07150, partial [Verrucomicrobiae bacterium]|nr:hypothetical protein [Verrucomicrobiae bacterium]
EQLNILQLSDAERSAYERYVGDNRDAKSIWRTYYGDGERAGLAQGKAEGKAEMIRKMNDSGLPISEIVKFVELPQKEVEAILR